MTAGENNTPASEPRGRRSRERFLIVPATAIGIIIGIAFGAIYAAIAAIIILTRTGF